MHPFYWIEVTVAGVARPIRPEDILSVEPAAGGSAIRFKDNRLPSLIVAESPSDILTAIETLRTDYNTALGDPA